MIFFVQTAPAQADLFLGLPAPMELSTEQINLLQAFASKQRVVWDLWDDYFFRYDTYQRCTKEAQQLLAMGLVEKPVMGQGRFCTVTASGFALLATAESCTVELSS